MLDAVIVVSTNDSYIHADWNSAKTIDYAYHVNTGKIAFWDGQYWYDIIDSIKLDFVFDRLVAGASMSRELPNR